MLALAGLGVVTLISASWADDRSGPLVDGARWLAYATALCTVASVASDRLSRRTLHLGLTAGAVAAAAYVEVRLLVGQGGPLFNGGRLTDPVGYANGEAAVLLMGFWLAFGVADRARRPAVSALAGGLAALQIALVVLTATRSAIPAAIASATLIVLLPKRRVRRTWLFLLCLGAAAIAAPAGLNVYDAPHEVAPPADVTRTAALWALLGAVIVALMWFAVRTASTRVTGTVAARIERFAAGGLVVIALGGLGGGLVVAGNPLDRVDRAWTSFTSLRLPPPGQSRFASVGGNRYDYWRVALQEFRAHPLGGVGGGNYVQEYYARRQTAEYIRQPHSLELQVLSELGLFGAVWLLLLLGVVAEAIWRGLRPAGAEAGAAAIGGAGVLATWTVQASVDWLHLLPGVTFLALTALVVVRPLTAVTLAPVPDEPTVRRWARVAAFGGRALPVAFAFLAICASVISVRVLLADRYRERAKDHLAEPARALRETADSLRYDRWSADSYYLRSAALARNGDYGAARGALFVVARREPLNFLPWVLLGDLATRRGLPAVAREDYRRAQILNPRDPAMAALVAGVTPAR